MLQEKINQLLKEKEEVTASITTSKEILRNIEKTVKRLDVLMKSAEELLNSIDTPKAEGEPIETVETESAVDEI